MTDENNGISIGETVGGEPVSPEMNLDSLLSAAQQLESTVSRFAEDTENGQGSLTTLLQQVSEQTTAANAGVQDVRSELRAKVEKLESWIKYNRR
jgi:hypothetical protein